jgi:hypothetical protein
MTYSKIHQRFAGDVVDRLIEPEKYMGPNYKEILNFWWFLEGLNDSQWENVGERYSLLGENFKHNGLVVSNSLKVQMAVESTVIWGAAQRVCVGEGRHIDQVYAVEWATDELISMHLTLEQMHSLVYVPLFDKL